MSQENVEALKALYEHWAVGDWSESPIYDPYVVAVAPDPTPRPQYGLRDARDYMRRFLADFEEVRMEASGFREVEGTVLVSVHRTVRGAGSGIELEDDSVHVWTFRGNRVIRVDVFEHAAEALEAVGLPE